jgi:hypothetical protein
LLPTSHVLASSLLLISQHDEMARLPTWILAATTTAALVAPHRSSTFIPSPPFVCGGPRISCRDEHDSCCPCDVASHGARRSTRIQHQNHCRIMIGLYRSYMYGADPTCMVPHPTRPGSRSLETLCKSQSQCKEEIKLRAPAALAEVTVISHQVQSLASQKAKDPTCELAVGWTLHSGLSAQPRAAAAWRRCQQRPTMQTASVDTPQASCATSSDDDEGSTPLTDAFQDAIGTPRPCTPRPRQLLPTTDADAAAVKMPDLSTLPAHWARAHEAVASVAAATAAQSHKAASDFAMGEALASAYAESQKMRAEMTAAFESAREEALVQVRAARWPLLRVPALPPCLRLRPASQGWSGGWPASPAAGARSRLRTPHCTHEGLMEVVIGGLFVCLSARARARVSGAGPAACARGGGCCRAGVGSCARSTRRSGRSGAGCTGGNWGSCAAGWRRRTAAPPPPPPPRQSSRRGTRRTGPGPRWRPSRGQRGAKSAVPHPPAPPQPLHHLPDRPRLADTCV